jgi:hypothetical protein
MSTHSQPHVEQRLMRISVTSSSILIFSSSYQSPLPVRWVFDVIFWDHLTLTSPVGRTLPFPKIYPKRPTASLVSKKVLASIIGQILITSGFQLWGYLWVRTQLWYLSALVAQKNGPNIVQVYTSPRNRSILQRPQS